MENKDCFLIGSIYKLHGYKGDILIFNSKEITLDLDNTKFLLINIDNDIIPFFIEKIRMVKNNHFLVKLSDINSEQSALKLLKKEVFIDSKLAIEDTNTKDNSLMNYKVIDKKHGILGIVYKISNQTLQELIYVRNETNDFSFPSHENFISQINHSKNEILVKIPLELIKLN